MTHEIGQFNDLKLQPLSSGRQSKKNTWTDIGEAQITHTIFGKARVRITRKNDRVRRSLLFAVMTISAALAAIQQGWISIQQTELQQSAVTKLGWSFAEPIRSLAVPPVSASLMDATSAAKGKPVALPQPETRNAPIAQKSAPPQQPIKTPETVAAKLATPQPLSVSRPQAAAPATAARPVVATIPVAVTTPAATATTLPAYKPLAANSPAADTPPVAKISGQEIASGSTVDTPSVAKPPLSSLAATSSQATVAPQALEPLPSQQVTDGQQQRAAVNEPGRSN